MAETTNSELRQPGPVLGGIIKVADRLALIGGYVAMACLLMMAFLMLGQVTVAFLSKFTTAIRGDIPIAWEYGAYLMGTAFLMGSAITLRADRHIRLGVVVQHCGPGTVRLLEIISSLLATAFAAYLALAFGQGAQRSIMLGTTSISSGTPIWIPMTIFALGTALLAIQFAVRLTCAVMRFDLVNPALQAGGEFFE